MIGATHVLFAIAISSILSLNIAYFIFGAVLPDIDFLLGIEHRGFTHSILFALLLYVAAKYRIGKREAVSLFIGIFSHMILDSVTYLGIMLFYPLSEMFSFGMTSASDSSANLFVIVLSLAVWANSDSLTEKLSQIESRKIRKYVYGSVFTWILLLGYFGWINYESVSVSTLLSDMNSWNGKMVSLNGTVCSSIEQKTFSSGNRYQIFSLCDKNDKIVVWKLSTIQNSSISEGQNIQIDGKFTTKYIETTGPELNYIRRVEIIG